LPFAAEIPHLYYSGCVLSERIYHVQIPIVRKERLLVSVQSKSFGLPGFITAEKRRYKRKWLVVDSVKLIREVTACRYIQDTEVFCGRWRLCCSRHEMHENSNECTVTSFTNPISLIV